MTFGEKVKEARLAMNLSQTELAQLTGISERSLYTYEQLGTLLEKAISENWRKPCIYLFLIFWTMRKPTNKAV